MSYPKQILYLILAPIMAPIVIVYTAIKGNKLAPQYTQNEILWASMKAEVISIALYVLLMDVL